MSDQGQEVVIVSNDGTEHVFPAGFDPKRAASIVRRQAGDAQAATAQAKAAETESVRSRTGQMYTRPVPGSDTDKATVASDNADVFAGAKDALLGPFRFAKDLYNDPVGAVKNLAMSAPNALGMLVTNPARAAGQAIGGGAMAAATPYAGSGLTKAGEAAERVGTFLEPKSNYLAAAAALHGDLPRAAAIAVAPRVLSAGGRGLQRVGSALTAADAPAAPAAPAAVSEPVAPASTAPIPPLSPVASHTPVQDTPIPESWQPFAQKSEKLPVEGNVPASKSRRTPMSATPGLSRVDVEELGLNPDLKLTGLTPEAIDALKQKRAQRAAMYKALAELDRPPQ